ncbi:hypothetical protein KFU94_48130 [Chloroflexi bacterium TSY]|nr:hypothetical protein [Chloroflexi bacterium TSY]
MPQNKTPEEPPMAQTQAIQTEANQIWSKLAPSQQQQIIQSLIQICLTLMQKRTERKEVAYEPSK